MAGAEGKTGPSYVERLRVPWWFWLLAGGVAALFATELWMGAAGLRAWVPFAVVLPVTGLAIWRLGRIRIAVDDAELAVDDAHLPLRHISDVIPIDAAGRRQLLGVAADPLAFVIQRPWVSGAVQVLVDDPADPTPYWVVSSRRPVQLAAKVMAARASARS